MAFDVKKLTNLFDQHVHSSRSHDSRETLSGYYERAKELGVCFLTFTNHIDIDYNNPLFHYFFEIEDEGKEIEEFNSSHPDFTFLQGIEIGFVDEHKDKLIKIISENKFNVVNLSLHYLGEIDLYHYEEFLRVGVDKLLKQYFKGLLHMVETFPDYDVVCHIDYGFKSAFKADPKIKISSYEELLIPLFKKIVELDKALEINTKVQETLNDDEHVKYILQLYKKCGGSNLTLSSDAHSRERLCSSFKKYITIIKSEGFNHICYFKDRKRYAFDLSD